MNRLQIKLVTLLLASVPIACGASSPLSYDEKTLTYTMQFPATTELKAQRSVSWRSKSRIDPQLVSMVEHMPNGSFRFRYQLSNGLTSKLTIGSFRLSPVISVLVADGGGTARSVALDREMPDRHREARKGLLAPSGWVGAVFYVPRENASRISFSMNFSGLDALRPGHEAKGFAFDSDALPGLIWVPFEGIQKLPEFPGEEFMEGGVREAYHKWQDDDVVKVAAVAPSVRRPNEWRLSSVLPVIDNEMLSWGKQKFIPTETADRLLMAVNQIARSRDAGVQAVISATRDLENLAASHADLPLPVARLLELYAKILTNVPK